jgi:hypothetical protein
MKALWLIALLPALVVAAPLNLSIEAKDAAGVVTHRGDVVVPEVPVVPPEPTCPPDCPPQACPPDCPPPVTQKQRVKLGEVGSHSYGSDSATWEFANQRAYQPWQRGKVGGNWLDAGGVPEGSVPYASLPILTAPPQAWLGADVTALVRAARDAGTGIFVRSRQVAGYPPKFASRQHANGKAATLTVTTEAGVIEVPVSIDTWMTVTSNSSQAITDYWSPDGILVFDLSAVQGEILSARINLWPTGWYGTVTLDFYLFDPPELLTRPAEQHPELVTTGLSATMTDAQLKADPRVLAFMDPVTLDDALAAFNSGWIESPHKVQKPSIVDWPGRKALRVGNGPDPQGATAVNAVVQTIKNPRATYNKPWMANSLPEAPEHLFVSYMIKVPTFTSAIEGAKLPSLDGNLSMYSYQDWPPEHLWPNDWGWGTSIHHYLPSYTNDGVLGAGVYMYDQDQQFSKPNRGAAWHTHAALIPGRIYHIEIEAKVNTCTAPNVFLRDGVWRVWLDGVLIYENLAWPARAHPNAKITATRMLIMHGGNNRPGEQQWYEISRFILSTERVGKPVN